MLKRATWVFLAAACAGNAGLAAQDPVFGVDTMAVADTIPDERPLPRGAFIRAMVVPGWGHLHIGEPRRGAVFFALQTTSWAMLITTMNRLSDAREREQRLTRLATDSLNAAIAEEQRCCWSERRTKTTPLQRQLSDPEAFEAAVRQHPGLAGLRGLVSARERHRQDWIVYTLTLTFAGAIDAYVTAHLKDFPADILATPTRDGGAALSVRLPVGGRR